MVRDCYSCDYSGTVHIRRCGETKATGFIEVEIHILVLGLTPRMSSAHIASDSIRLMDRTCITSIIYQWRTAHPRRWGRRRWAHQVILSFLDISHSVPEFIGRQLTTMRLYFCPHSLAAPLTHFKFRKLYINP
jgi:hypothetical protein